jgi:hypothetical protein
MSDAGRSFRYPYVVLLSTLLSIIPAKVIAEALLFVIVGARAIAWQPLSKDHLRSRSRIFVDPCQKTIGTAGANGTTSAWCCFQHSSSSYPAARVPLNVTIMSSARGDDELQGQDKVVAQQVDSATTTRSQLESEELFLHYLASSASATDAALKSKSDSACPSDTTVAPPTLDVRTMCPSCHRSRSIYCPTCLKLLIDPPPDQLRLPFDLDIILDDQRECATGVHVKILSDVVVVATTTTSGSAHHCCRLFDYDRGRGDALDSYDDDDNNIDGTYVLFPGEDSVPLHTLEPAKVKRLVVLDCKWVRLSAGHSRIMIDLILVVISFFLHIP